MQLCVMWGNAIHAQDHIEILAEYPPLFYISLRYIEHTAVFFSFSLASGLPRVLLRVQHLIVCQLRSCHNKCFLRESNTFTP